MKDIAHISFAGGGLIVPAHTPYDCELLVEHIELSTKRYGYVRLEVNRQRWTISLNNGLGAVCAACSRWPDNLGYPSGSTGRLSVVSSRAPLCTDGMCELAAADAHA